LRKYFKGRGFRALALLVGAGSLAIAAACTPVKPEAPPPDPSAGTCLSMTTESNTATKGTGPNDWNFGSVGTGDWSDTPPPHYPSTVWHEVTNNCADQVDLDVNLDTVGLGPDVGDFRLTGENNCSFPDSGPGRVLNPGEQCQMNAAFTPLSVGDKSFDLVVSTDDPADGQLGGHFTGNGTPALPAQLAIEPLANQQGGAGFECHLLLGNVPQIKTCLVSLRVTNTGEETTGPLSEEILNPGGYAASVWANEPWTTPPIQSCVNVQLLPGQDCAVQSSWTYNGPYLGGPEPVVGPVPVGTATKRVHDGQGTEVTAAMSATLDGWPPS
jgi:hypothetical protein